MRISIVFTLPVLFLHLIKIMNSIKLFPFQGDLTKNFWIKIKIYIFQISTVGVGFESKKKKRHLKALELDPTAWRHRRKGHSHRQRHGGGAVGSSRPSSPHGLGLCWVSSDSSLHNIRKLEEILWSSLNIFKLNCGIQLIATVQMRVFWSTL